jgi:hypothetical protein
VASSGKAEKAKAKTGTEPAKRRAYLPAAERRKSIIAAAQEVFARSNLKGARTRDIARAAAVNQATIFEHFESSTASTSRRCSMRAAKSSKGWCATGSTSTSSGSRSSA